MDPNTFFARLWDDFLAHAPSAEGIHALLGGGAPIVNDHIALRTFATERLGVDALDPLFGALGYELGDHYRFRAKKLRARYYRHPDPAQPKIFISELLLDECSGALRDTVLPLCEQVPAGAADEPAGRRTRLSARLHVLDVHDVVVDSLRTGDHHGGPGVGGPA